MQRLNEFDAEEFQSTEEKLFDANDIISCIPANDNIEALSGKAVFQEPVNDNEPPSDEDFEEYTEAFLDLREVGLVVGRDKSEEASSYLGDRPDDERSIRELDFSEPSVSRRGFLSEDFL